MLDTLSLRLAAGGGMIDDLPAAALVSAGFTLLQRSPALVRAFGRGRGAILLPPSPQFLVAIAASEGRSAVLLDPNLRVEVIATALRDEGVGAVMTFRSLEARLPAATPRVLLDDAPRAARFVDASGRGTDVDLGTHFGLTVEGATDVEGRAEECLVTVADPDAPASARLSHSHRALLAAASKVAKDLDYASGDRIRAGWDWSRPGPLTATLLAPLVVGASIRSPSARA